MRAELPDRLKSTLLGSVCAAVVALLLLTGLIRILLRTGGARRARATRPVRSQPARISHTGHGLRTQG